MNLRDAIHNKLPARLLPVVADTARFADAFGKSAVLVGGVVRDLMLGRDIEDTDIMIEPPVQPIVERLAKERQATFVSYERFQTFTVDFPVGGKLDVVTAREESYAKPAALPSVTPSTIEKDLKRRDFTINAMACFLNEDRYGEVMDPFRGALDLERKTIRVLHEKSFEDDPTRLFRAARFSGRFGFGLDSGTETLIRSAVAAKLPALLSPVRRRHEFEMILKEDDPWPALELLQNWSLLPFVHQRWSLELEHKKLKEVPRDLADRLASFLRPWGRDDAEKTMTDLAFEKVVKRKVLEKI